MSSSTSQLAPTLFTPIRVGNMHLQHRIVLAPLTRYRAIDDYVPSDIAVDYYAQRASTPGTLLITEATTIAPRAVGYFNVPGIWNNAQIAAWKKVTDAVHAQKSFLFMQLWAHGRAALPEVLRRDGPYDLVGPSAIPMDDEHQTPRPLTVQEIKEYAQLYAQAAKNAIQAGCDGVEIHAANGYLLDQFLQTKSNQRTDEYGGSIENRIRFACEVVDAIASAIGPESTALRLSPWSIILGMRMPDPIPTFGALMEHLAKHQPRLAYIHLVEPRTTGDEDVVPGTDESNDFARDIWGPRPLLLAGGFTRETAIEEAERGKMNVLVAVGRQFTSNPDLPGRWMRGKELTPYDRSTFYTQGAKGYSDWPFLQNVVA
ncbi:unnamed protein product [Peniophora sp. CBMAI 1063]|nr:unnamed protein product [Peniophora sp. CBMAI 1063]